MKRAASLRSFGEASGLGPAHRILMEGTSTSTAGGEMQRVAIGRAIVRAPRVFVMDELLTHLDAELREELREELPALARRLSKPERWATHDLEEALSMSQRVAVLACGRLARFGTPGKVCGRLAGRSVSGRRGVGSARPHDMEGRRNGEQAVFWGLRPRASVLRSADPA